VQIGEERGERADLRVEGRVRRSVRYRTIAELGCRPGGVRPERQRRAVGLRREHPHLGLDRHEALPHQSEIVDHGPSQAADGVHDPGGSETRRELDRVEDPACPVASLEAETLPAGLRQVRRRHEAVVARPDDHGVVSRRHATLPFPERAPRSSSAAIRPGAPMIPPPGWVAEPHIHRSLIGVR
jgi:hypothetical protein